MNIDNPYRAPSAAVADIAGNGEPELAGIGHRFGAATIDGILVLLFMVAAGYATGMFDSPLSGGSALVLHVAIALAGLAFFALTQSYFLKKSGQTIGKKIVGIRIVDLEDRLPSLGALLIRRYGFMFLVYAVPIFGGVLFIIDDLFIFKRDRRCLHDLVAKTKVVLNGPKYSAVTWLVAPFMFLFVIGMVASFVAPMFQDDTPKPARPAPPNRASRGAAPPARHSPAAPRPATPAPAPADAAAPAPVGKGQAAPGALGPGTVHDTMQTQPDAARATVDAGARQRLETSLRKCLDLKEPVAVIRCSEGVK